MAAGRVGVLAGVFEDVVECAGHLRLPDDPQASTTGLPALHGRAAQGALGAGGQTDAYHGGG